MGRPFVFSSTFSSNRSVPSDMATSSVSLSDMPLIITRNASPESAQPWSVEAKIAMAVFAYTLARDFKGYAAETEFYGTCKGRLRTFFLQYATALKPIGTWLVVHVTALGGFFLGLCGYREESDPVLPLIEQPVVLSESQLRQRRQKAPTPPSSPAQEKIEIRIFDSQGLQRRSCSSLDRQRHPKPPTIGLSGDFRVPRTNQLSLPLRHTSSNPFY
ncbi:hypothetical protein IWX49DRAFT_566001 [Phyllosticta citricarpa]|uniref:Uncharacterized protein n=2 Tax=Phyllosticta TaxID=121621 RepID=A0ABR1MDL2_9PEZI